jgi:hypothetical protein
MISSGPVLQEKNAVCSRRPIWIRQLQSSNMKRAGDEREPALLNDETGGYNISCRMPQQ